VHVTRRAFAAAGRVGHIGQFIIFAAALSFAAAKRAKKRCKVAHDFARGCALIKAFDGFADSFANAVHFINAALETLLEHAAIAHAARAGAFAACGAAFGLGRSGGRLL
jgi:hypothetical protein